MPFWPTLPTYSLNWTWINAIVTYIIWMGRPRDYTDFSSATRALKFQPCHLLAVWLSPSRLVLSGPSKDPFLTVEWEWCKTPQPHGVLVTIKRDNANKILSTISGSWWLHRNHYGSRFSSASSSFSCSSFLLFLPFHRHHHHPCPHHHLYVMRSLSKPTCFFYQSCSCVRFSADWLFSARPAFLPPWGQHLL